MRQSWRSAPQCAKCRRKSPTMEWGRWLRVEGVGIIRSTNLLHDEALRLTCVACGFQWLMDLAPVETPKTAAVPA